MRLPIVCSQCKLPLCADACPVGALRRTETVVELDESSCISCMKCVEACPFGAIYAHGDWTIRSSATCAAAGRSAWKNAPRARCGSSPSSRWANPSGMNNILSYTHMKEIEFTEKGEQRTIRYAEIGKEELS